LFLLLTLVLLASNAGGEEQLLREKAREFRAALLDRHLSPEGLVLYRIDLETIRTDLRSGTYPDLADTPTFNGLYAATACTRAGIEEGDAAREARADADRALAGLELLMDVTGRRGLLARGIRRIKEPAPDEGRKKWFPGALGLERYRWRGDVSVDQYANGLLPAASACRALFPARAGRLVTDFASHLLDNGLQIVDADGRRTRFGDLRARSGFGLNSIAQLTAYAALALAAELDPDPRWAAARDRRRDRYRVAARGRTTNVRVLGVTNHSNDLMAWNLYRVLIPLARRTRDPALADLRHGMHRTWLRVRRDRNPYFVGVLCSVEPESCDLGDLVQAREILVHFPLEKRRVERPPGLDQLPLRLLPGRKWRRLAREVVPMELRSPSSLEWKSSPYRVRRGVNPGIEYTGVDYLAAYWLHREVEKRIERR
jgi:hypothetical protein